MLPVLMLASSLSCTPISTTASVEEVDVSPKTGGGFTGYLELSGPGDFIESFTYTLRQVDPATYVGKGFKLTLVGKRARISIVVPARAELYGGETVKGSVDCGN